MSEPISGKPIAETPVSKDKKKSSPAWLLHYNALSAALWGWVLFNTCFQAIINGQPTLFENSHKQLIAIQCFAIVEIYNSLVGNVRAPLFTTAAQVFSRLLIVIGIFTVIPESPVNYSPVYVSLCVAWSVTEIIRYSFYAINIETNGNPPLTLIWFRYSTFIPLYPLGISSECWIVFKSLEIAAEKVGNPYKYFLIGTLLTYIPGSYILFTYMLKQRKKTLKKLKEKTA